MSSQQDDPAAACPVDHKTREAWLKQARTSQSQPPLQTSGCDSSQMNQSAPSPPPTSLGILGSIGLGTQREVSTIPRATPSEAASRDAAPASKPANSERDTGADKKTGNWIYPSEQMFFEAMKRKSYDPQAADMKTIVPIHNAVNERAWMEIKRWEKGRGSEVCGGPRLVSFSGLSTSLTPRARFNTLLGYKPPFDRHDWVVDRCGTKVEYVIDFYAGKDEGKPGKELNFYLDVRPKLNSWEGVKMRAFRFVGL
ncbi:cytochrome c1 heme lyase-like protein [Trematosphaeria pertusa]|uniref:Holocytochrome c-type synthase n=1 Tax=Trematosphaeria pertusa TaxID=390896 RepID=A0A6A6J1D5_9PLEO|nr:cytochrome c1 heme lyase-like protein [Trematosphaeria pertusa]KAF2256675.1 cytochrome c1 heme lyase-like protein [Trematosphaeria pertusa]